MSPRSWATGRWCCSVIRWRKRTTVAGLFVVEERGSHELKGVLEPVTLYRLCAGERRWTPRETAPSHAAGRSRGRDRYVDAALGAGAAGRRSVGDDRWRARI